MSKVTINVVAEYAGVSKKTVSRVLNDEPNVSEKTKLKVKAAFEALSYRPNPQARGLASNQSFLIGLVYDNPNKSYVTDIQTGALEVCNREGYHLLINPADHESDGLLTNLSDLLLQSQLDGLVLTPPFSDMPNLLDMLDNTLIPYVRIAATTEHLASLCVINNDEESAYEMTQHLISLGHTAIGFIKGHPNHKVSEQRFLGYKNALKDNHLDIQNQFVKQGYFDHESGEKCARQLLSIQPQPTAIFASNDYMAAGVVKVASQKNLSIPHDLSVVGFDDALISRHIWPSLTTVQQPVQSMAIGAVDMLIKSIRKEKLNTNQQAFENKLIVRESSAPVKVSHHVNKN